MQTFRLTWDYRCPFARIANEHVIEALEAGADWKVEFVPFSLGQAHVEEGQPPIWDHPDDDTGLLALQAAIVVRDRFADHFLAVHRALFEARHADGLQLRDRAVITKVLDDAGVDASAVFVEVDDGWPLETIRKEHEQVVAEADVWGVPTFMVDNRAVFVRLMERPNGDSAKATRTVERILEMITGFPELNEFKCTVIPR